MLRTFEYSTTGRFRTISLDKINVQRPRGYDMLPKGVILFICLLGNRSISIDIEIQRRKKSLFYQNKNSTSVLNNKLCLAMCELFVRNQICQVTMVFSYLQKLQWAWT